MLPRVHRTVSDLPLTWDRTRFHAARTKRRQARKLLATSIIVQMEKRLRQICAQNKQLEKMLVVMSETSVKHERKLQMVDALRDIATHSLSTHLKQRMETIRSVIDAQSHIVHQILHEENEYWREIHTILVSHDLVPPKPLLTSESAVTIKEEWPEIALSPEKLIDTLPSIDTTLVIKSDDSFDDSSLSLAPAAEREVQPMHSHPNYPPPLYFSPTILEEEQSQPLTNILSPFEETHPSSDSLDAFIPLERMTHEDLLQYLDEDVISQSSEQQPGDHASPVSDISVPRRQLRTRSITTKRKPSRTTTVVLRQRNTSATAGTNKKNQTTSLPDIDPSRHYSVRFFSRYRPPSNFSPLTVHAEEIDQESENAQCRLRQQKKSAKC